MRMIRTVLISVILTLLVVSLVWAQEPVYWDVATKIREEGFERSQIMEMIGYMTDVIGPRLTASPSMRKAQDWARRKFEEIGLVNVVIEETGTHGVSWDNEYTSLHLMEPDYQPLLGYSKAFAPGTNGKIAADAVIVEINSEDDFSKYRGRLYGKIALIASEFDVPHHFNPCAVRYTDEQLKQLERTSVVGDPSRQNVTISRQEYNRLRRGEVQQPFPREKLDEFLKAEGVAMLVDRGTGRWDHGSLLVTGRPGSRGNRDYESARNALPEVSLAVEHYNRIYRILKRGIPVKLEMEVRNYLNGSDPMYYNVVGELPGTDLRDEIVIVGGHYDSWHTGTGAVDNATGCAVALEAVRILKAIGVQPRRTIKVAWWSYEEGGLFGSRGYVNKHFGNQLDGIKPAYNKFCGYFNMDNGTGRFRGVWLQGNKLVHPIFQAWMEPLKDLGMTTLSLRTTGGTDHLSFDRAGLPGWQFIQDRIDYSTVRHHTNLDVYDGVVPEDVMVNAVIMATFAYHAAMRDEMLPRKPYTPPPPRR